MNMNVNMMLDLFSSPELEQQRTVTWSSGIQLGTPGSSSHIAVRVLVQAVGAARHHRAPSRVALPFARGPRKVEVLQRGERTTTYIAFREDKVPDDARATDAVALSGLRHAGGSQCTEWTRSAKELPTPKAPCSALAAV